MAKRANFRLMLVAIMAVLIGTNSVNGSTVLFEDNFNDGDANGWEEYDGVFSVVSNVYRIESTGSWNDARSAVIDSNWSNCFIDLDFNNLTTNKAACVLFRVQEVASGTDAGRYYQLHIHPNKVGFAEIDYSGGYATLLAEVPFTVLAQMWHHVQIRINGTQATAYIDGEYVLSHDGFGKYTYGGIGLKIINGGVVLFDNVIITGPVLESIEIVGPDEVAENSQIHYKAIAHYDDSTRDVTDTAIWSVETNDIADVNAGMLTTEMVDLPTDITITAQYSEGDIGKSAEKQVSILAICPGGSALQFDGQDDYVDLGNDAALKPDVPLTICAWINLSELNTSNRILALDYNLQRYYGVWFKVQTNNTLEISYGDGAGTGPNHRRSRVGVTELDKNIWYHVAAVIKGPTDMDLYINGIDDDGSYSGSGGPLAYSVDGSSSIGYNYTYGTFFYGLIDEVQLYNRALSTEEVRANIFRRPDIDDPNLLDYWDFDQGEGQLAVDSAAENHGILGASEYVDESDPNWFTPPAPVSRCTLDALVQRNLNDIVNRKLAVIDELATLSGNESALLDYMDWAFHAGQLDNLNKGDVVKAKEKIHSAIQHEQQAQDMVGQSINKLDDAMSTLGVD